MSTIVPEPFQLDGAKWALATLREYGLAYLAWEERVGKSITSLLVADYSKAERILIITTKKGMNDSWLPLIKKWESTKDIVVINYESVHKVEGKFGLVILDEAHKGIASYPKTSATWKKVFSITRNKVPILYTSATPYPESLSQIYHQFKLSFWSPFKKYGSFRDWHKVYGIPNKIKVQGILRETYKVVHKDKVLKDIEHLFYFKTRQEAGIEHEPQANIVYVTPSSSTLDLLNTWLDYKYLELNGEEVFSDSIGKQRSVHYQIEGGTVKLRDSFYELPSLDKIEFIKRNYDLRDVGIFAHFIAERVIIQRELPEVQVFSSDGDAEAIDLSHIKKMVLYSQSEKTVKARQRMARQANRNRKEEIIFDVLVMDKPFVGATIQEYVWSKNIDFDAISYKKFLKETL